MIKILFVGITGAMGQTFLSVLPQDMRIVSGVGKGILDVDFPIYESITEVTEDFDVIVDFSHVNLLDGVLDFALEHKKPLLIASTGITETLHDKIDAISQSIPIVQSGNYSYGVYALTQAVKLLSEILEDTDVEIIEKHHRFKKDAPSGTAEMLVNAVEQVRGDMDIHYGRSGQSDDRNVNDLGVHSIRGGTIVGEHSVIFADIDEVVEITHTAASKKIFAKGAFKAIYFIVKQDVGRYDLGDVVHG